MIKSNFGGHGVVPGSYVGPMPTAPNMEGQQTASNSNSANGGSVNSQDSLWNVKGAPAMQSQDPAMMHMMNAYQMQTQGYNVYDAIAMQQQQQQIPANSNNNIPANNNINSSHNSCNNTPRTTRTTRILKNI